MRHLIDMTMEPSQAASADAATSTATLALMIAGVRAAQTAGELLRGLPVDAAPEAVLEAAGVTRAAVNASFAKAHALVQQGLEAGIEAVPLCSARYPALLRLLPDAPPVLYVRGQLAALAARPMVAVVGTRRATQSGLTIAERLGAYLCSHGWCVVSGLSTGIDMAAHAGGLASGEPTLAVLAHGLERVRPRSNLSFAERILAQGGAWVSEYPCGTPARDEQLVQSNRIQVGLSVGSVVVEAASKSAVQAHAEVCLRQRRVLFAVVPDHTPTQSQLPRELVDKGAQAIRSRDDYPAMLKALATAAAAFSSKPSHLIPGANP